MASIENRWCIRLNSVRKPHFGLKFPQFDWRYLWCTWLLSTRILMVLRFCLLFLIATNAEISDQLINDNNADTDSNSEIRQKYVPEAELMPNRNHRLSNTLQPVQRYGRTFFRKWLSFIKRKISFGLKGFPNIRINQDLLLDYTTSKWNLLDIFD